MSQSNDSRRSAADAPAKGVSSGKTALSMGAMAIMLTTSILSLRGLPAEAKYGVQSIFYYLFAAAVFLLPFAMVCAELASTYTRQGGLYRWVSEAFGPRWGWTAMFLEWQVVVAWFPTILMFAATTLAYIGPDSVSRSLASSKAYTLTVSLAVLWAAMFNSMRGQRSANMLTTYGGLVGTIIPGAVLIILGVIYVCMGRPVLVPDVPFLPDFGDPGTIVLAASIFLFYAGMEFQAVHINQMERPERDFPRAVFLTVLIVVGVYAAGTMVISAAIPTDNINLLQSLLVAYKTLWANVGLEWLGNVMAVFIMFGVIGQISALVTGPATGLMSVARSGYLPRSLQRTNRNGVNVAILLIEGGIISVLCLVMVVLPTVESAFQIMSQMATITYLTMVLMIYGAFIRLRRTQPGKRRGFKVPGGRFGEIAVCTLGIAGALLALVLSFLPPAQIATGSPVVYVGILVVGVIVIISLPLAVYALRKPSWRNPDTDFHPFDWQIERRRPSQRSSWPDGYEPSDDEVKAADNR